MTPQQIKALRDELGWTQQQMGSFLNVSQVGIWRWESAQATPDAYRMAALKQLRIRLDQARVARQQQEFIEGLKVAGALGVLALLVYLFSR